MGLEKIEVSPLFIEPFFRADLSDYITDEQVDFIKSLEMVPNRTNLISDNLYIFEHKKLSKIRAGVQEALDYYANEVMGIPQKLYVTQSWSLVNGQNVGMHGHSHSNSVISGSLYFTDLPEPPSRMIFDKHRTYQQLQLIPQQDKQNLYNTPVNVVTPKKNELFLFSSSLQHLVEANQSSDPRYSIAFNTFIKGKLGNYRDVSELTI